MSFRNETFTKYEDRCVSFLHPNDWVVEFGGMSYLAWPRNKRMRGCESLALTVSLPSATHHKDFVYGMRRDLSVPLNVEWQGCRQYTIRSGAARFWQDSTERVLIIENAPRRSTTYEWRVLKPLSPAFLLAIASGEGDFSADEPRWRELLESVELHSTDFEAIEPTRPPAKRPQGKRSEARRKKLEIALSSLPDDLKYLAPAALALSDECSDAILAGDADMTVLQQAIETVTANLSRTEAFVLIASHRRQLHEWLERHPDCTKSSSSGLHAIEGGLLGFILFSEPRPSDEILRLAGIE